MSATGIKKQNKAARLFSPTFTEQLFDLVPTQAFVLSADAETILASNLAAQSFLGYSARELQDLRTSDIFTNLTEEDLKTALLPLENSPTGQLTIRVSLLHKDGSVTPAKLSFSQSHEDKAPNITALVTGKLVTKTDASTSSMVDIHVQKLAKVAENMSRGVLLHDEAGRADWINDAFTELTGYELEEVKGRSPNEFLYGPETNPVTVAEVKEHLLAHKRVNRELLIYHKSGHKLWVEVDIRPVLDAAGTIDCYVAVATDITKRKIIEDSAAKLTKELEEEKYRFELAAIGSNNGIWDWDIQTGNVYYSPRFRELLGYSPEEFPDELECFPAIIHPDDAKRARNTIKNHLSKQVPYDLEYRLKTKDGSYRWFRSKGQALWDEFGHAVRMAGSITDISEHKQTEDAIKYLAKTDALTGLPNRTLFHEQLQSAISEAKRIGSKVGVMLLDLDHFKNVNDTMGHPAGDALLCEVGRRLQNCVRETDTVARLGGDEFAIVAPNINIPEDTNHLAERIVNKLSEPFELDGQRVLTGSSIGITVFPESTGSSDDLLRNADIALYDAKAAGRGVHRIYDCEMNKRVQARRMIERDLRLALDEGQLELYYQPQISLSSMQIIGAEALLRWQHPDRGLIMPGEFIPVAEATRMIISLGEWVIKTACEQNKQWQMQGLPNIVVAVNVSPLQFKHQDMLPNLFETVAASGLDPQWLEIEITEAVAMKTGTVRVLNELKDFGVKLSIDDFGTGYSSLSRLRNFPVDRLKIDRSFVKSIESEWDNGAIGATIIQLGHSLNLNVIAEGVETTAELEHLQEMGCDEVQGYLFGRPMPATDFVEFLLRHSPNFQPEHLGQKLEKMKQAS